MLLLVGDNQSTAVVRHIRHSKELKRRSLECVCWLCYHFVGVLTLWWFAYLFLCLLKQRILYLIQSVPVRREEKRKVCHVTYFPFLLNFKLFKYVTCQQTHSKLLLFSSSECLICRTTAVDWLSPTNSSTYKLKDNRERGNRKKPTAEGRNTATNNKREVNKNTSTKHSPLLL